MIHSVSANNDGFRRVEFTPGLNVVLADRHREATAKDTRNGVGKTLLIEIIHYCLGGSQLATRRVTNKLSNWTFTLDLTLRGRRLTVSRSVSKPKDVVLLGDTADWSELPVQSSLFGPVSLTVDQWTHLLGTHLFDLPDEPRDEMARPSFRKLISYLIRRQDAYQSPERAVARQPAADRDLQVSHLLGMNWEFASRWQALRQKESLLRSLKAALKEGLLEAGMSANVGELEARRVRLEEDVSTSAAALHTFQVHPQYETLQREADELTQQLHDLTNQNYNANMLLSRYRESVEEEAPPPDLSLERMYEDAGVLFSESVRQTLEDARTFHREVVSNRRRFLADAIDRLGREVAERGERIRQLTEERSTVLRVLVSHGALSEFTALQERHVALREKLERIKTQTETVKRSAQVQQEIREERTSLLRLMQADYDERRPSREAAIRWFNENSQALYESPGNLIVNVGTNGYQYRAEIPRGESEGINRMQVFCFDLMVLRLQKRLGRAMDFLIHDSALYDPVDGRQRAKALEQADRITKEIGGQYICAMNSDMVPEGEFSPDFDYRQFVRLRLSDEAPEGRLLGLHF